MGNTMGQQVSTDQYNLTNFESVCIIHCPTGSTTPPGYAPIDLVIPLYWFSYFDVPGYNILAEIGSNKRLTKEELDIFLSERPTAIPNRSSARVYNEPIDVYYDPSRLMPGAGRAQIEVLYRIHDDNEPVESTTSQVG